MHQRHFPCVAAPAVLFVGILVLPAAGLSAQGRPQVSVTVLPPAPVPIVLFSADAAGKVLTTTNQKGEGTIDGDALGKLGQLEVLEETCGSSRRVLLVASNSKVADAKQCTRRSIGSFASGKDKTLKVELFTPLERAAIPDPPASQPVATAQKASAPPAAAPVRTPATTAKAGSPCPAGASMVGAKLDLSPDADSFEKAPLLVPCAYRGVADTDKDRWVYYKFQVEKGQTLKVTARLRDAELPAITYSNDSRLFVRMHDANGAQIGKGCSIQRGSEACVQEAKAEESGVVFVSMRWTVRDAAFLVAVQ